MDSLIQVTNKGLFLVENTPIVRTWFGNLTGNEPLMIVGSCSAETEDQVLKIARAVKDTAQVYRAGIWKPRTRPGYFEGVGAPAFSIIRPAKSTIGRMKTTLKTVACLTSWAVTNY